MRVLVVEDDLALQDQLQRQLRTQGFVVDSACDGEEGLYYGREYDYDAAVIDLGLPKLDGIDLITRLRADERSFPVLILTARGNWQDKVQGLEAGADDYLTKPFHMEELEARINALLRRAGGYASPVIQHGVLSLDTGKKEVRLSDEAVELTAYEYRVLEYLVLNPDRVISKAELTDHLYEQDFDRDSNVIEVFIGRLRKKLDPVNPIRTIRGQGYRFSSETAG
ncbi:MAG: response regulator transcription factor [Pseudomonadales bacterium]|jgi:two-component system response regulator PhoP|nr:response regulator transcription factor [Pseudomonadales bacterium]MDP6471988.1 response regulator transcription factor [Pseudomonadales bacterium]MDP6826741.1 response regulator transcription factor [Pseudomonadales bacterium]MDP6972675.1 response regulator transcription factor [Pseudomonadales bacterium]|tara:strand:- start:279 stop:950 length:672 start_codon:yes stop_codon:yes gene_type:complete